jgi:hypothetical protein
MMCRYPDFPRIFFQDVLCVFFFNMCNIVNEFFMNKLVLTKVEYGSGSVFDRPKKFLTRSESRMV